MKKCFYCGKEFEINFCGSGGKNRAFCYDCYPEGLSRNERNALRKKLITLKAGKIKIQRGCDICGYNKCAAALEWHHYNDNKNFNPGDILRDGSVKSYILYEEEIKKCQLLCANCHREEHERIKNEMQENAGIV